MSVFTAAASTLATTPHLRPARVVGCMGQGKLAGSGPGCISYLFQPLVTERIRTMEIRNPVMRSTRRHSSLVICAAALNARCASEQTQTVTRQAPTMTHIAAKEKLPDLDDGGTGFPPRDDGDGGGGGGGGGGNWSGGFFFFGFLAFLGFLKDKESEGPYQNDRRR